MHQVCCWLFLNLLISACMLIYPVYSDNMPQLVPSLQSSLSGSGLLSNRWRQLRTILAPSNVPALVARTQSYLYPPSGMLAAIYGTVFACSKAPCSPNDNNTSSPTISPSCPTEECNISHLNTLALCSECADISHMLSWNKSTTMANVRDHLSTTTSSSTALMLASCGILRPIKQIYNNGYQSQLRRPEADCWAKGLWKQLLASLKTSIPARALQCNAI